MAVRPPDDDPLDVEGLFRAHATPLLRLALVLTGDRSLAEELVQEAFVRFYGAGSPPAAGAELAYLRRPVINLSHGHPRPLRVARNRPVGPPPAGARAASQAAPEGKGAVEGK